MIIISKMKKYDNTLTYEVEDHNNVIKRDVYYINGVLSRPKEDDMLITVSLGNSEYKTISIPIQNNPDEKLEEQDVMLTNGKSKIHLKFKNDIVEVIADKIVLNAKKEVEVASKTTFKKDVFFKGSMDHNGKKVDSTHTHKYQESLTEAPLKAPNVGPATVINIPKETQTVS